MEEKPVELSEITSRMDIGKKHTPPYPVIMSEGKMNPVAEACKYESLRQFNLKDQDVIKQVKNMIKPLIDNDYTIDYYKVKQKFVGPANNVQVSFHSWYYDKATEGDTDMTGQEMKGELIVGAIAITEDITGLTNRSLGCRKVNGLAFNSFGDREVYIRKNCRWPRFENSFRILHTNEELDPEFITVCYCDEYKEAVVTLHVALFVINNGW